MAISAGQFVVTSATPVALNAGDRAQTLTVKHLSPNDKSCELGPAGFALGTGYILWPGEQRQVEVEVGEVLEVRNYVQADVLVCVLRT